MFFRNKSKESSKKTIDKSLPSAESARNRTFAVRRKESDDKDRYRRGGMTVKEAIQYRIELGEFDCTVDVLGKDYDTLKHLCWANGYNIKIGVMAGTGDDAQITARITW